MFAGVSWQAWAGFHVAVVVLLLVDAVLERRAGSNARSLRRAWTWTFVLALLAGLFALGVSTWMGRDRALEFVAGYAIETSLSVDNLFVFLVIFQGFRLNSKQQHRALLWGVGGAIVLRAVCIAAGVALVERFEWVQWIFAALLGLAAVKMLRGGSAEAALPGWLKQLQKRGGGLLLVIVAVELTDLLFAVDSIPAVLGVSRSPFVVYTSNIAAVLGLRSLYFALAGLMDRFRYLHYGLGALLGFVALKMLAARWIEIGIGWSLAVMGLILATSAVASLVADGRQA